MIQCNDCTPSKTAYNVASQRFALQGLWKHYLLHISYYASGEVLLSRYLYETALCVDDIYDVFLRSHLCCVVLTGSILCVKSNALYLGRLYLIQLLVNRTNYLL